MLEEQWLRIYRETVRPLYGYLAKRTGGDKALTEDIVQESYLRALDGWRHKAAPDEPLAWLKQVARNILIDHLRRKKWNADAGPAGVDGVEARTPADEFESLELFLAIAALGHRKARALEAFYFDGMSVREIAGEMAVSERAVEGLLRRARTEPALRHRVELGLVPKSALSEFSAALAGQEAAIGDLENHLALRRRFLSGEISAGELEIQTCMSAAQKELREAQSSIDTIRPRLDDLRAKAAVGLVTIDELRGMELGLSAVQAKAELALQEIEILKTIR